MNNSLCMYAYYNNRYLIQDLSLLNWCFAYDTKDEQQSVLEVKSQQTQTTELFNQ